MQSDNDLQTTLSKWPFILGDVLLVSTALAIAILGEWELSNVQVASCVISVALGAGLFVLPYIVEFRVRIREEAEDRSADLRVLQRQAVSAEEQFVALAERIESLEIGLSDLAEIQPDRSTPSDSTADRIKPLAEVQAAQSEQLVALAGKMDALAKTLESKPDAGALTLLQTEISTLQAELTALSSSSKEFPTPEADASGPDVGGEEDVPVEAAKTEPIAKKIRAPRQRRAPEPSLLKRAIGEEEGHSSAAVSRIIGSKSKQAEAAQDSPTSWDDSTVDGGIAFVEPESEDARPAPVQPTRPPRIKKSDTAIIASVFIGIGNKPFVRGSGAGLSWDTGIALEFEAIGKWRWIAPADMKELIEIQLFRNDEDPDTNGKFTLAPGQQLSLSPVF